MTTRTAASAHRLIRHALAVGILGALACGAFGQSNPVPIETLAFKQPERGPVPWPQQLTLGSGYGAWTASFVSDDGEPWLVLEPERGNAPSTITLSLVRWRAESRTPNTYSGTLTILGGGTTRRVKIAWQVVPAAPDPTFTYVAPQRGCTQTDGSGHHYPDPAVCDPVSRPAPAADGSYTDPNFGATVRMLTERGIYHTYSTPNPLSAHNKYLMTFLANGTFDIVESSSGRVLRKTAAANQSFFWDADDDEIYYFLDGGKVMQVDVASGRASVYVDYSSERGFNAILRGGTGDTSKDDWIAFWAPGASQVCALDLPTKSRYCADYSTAAVPYGAIDYTLMSKGVDRDTGKRYLVLVAGGGAGVYSVNPATRRLDFEARPESAESAGNHDGVCDRGEKCMYPSHSDTFEDARGIQYLVYDQQTESPCEVSVATYQLSKREWMMAPSETGGGKRRIMSLWQCPFPNTPVPEDHVACAKKAPFCVVSTTIPRRAQGSAAPAFAHAGEIIVIRGNGDEVRRLARNRSEPFNEEGPGSYWSQARAAIANDGSVVVADSNFGEVNGQRVLLIRTGFGPGAGQTP